MTTRQGPPISFRDRAIEPLLDARGPRNQVASRDLARYYALIQRETGNLEGTLTAAEWMLCRDALNGFALDDNGPRAVWLSVADAIRLNGLADTWQVDGDALIERLRAMPPAQATALVDAVERWWVARDREP